MSGDSLPHGALTGKVAVVVGGASGIGRTAASALARQGARIVIADFDTERMERTLAEILHLGSADAALALTTDVRNDGSVTAMAGDAIKAMGHVDVLLNMAGVFLQGPLDRVKPADWRWVLETNLLGTLRTCMAFAPHMALRGSGHIVNATSAAMTPMTVAYDSSSAAVATFTNALAEQLRPKGVSVALFTVGSDGPRIGQNTRSRGMGRLLHATQDPDEIVAPDGRLIDDLLGVLLR